jgi:hypothetical protein
MRNRKSEIGEEAIENRKLELIFGTFETQSIFFSPVPVSTLQGDRPGRSLKNA